MCPICSFGLSRLIPDFINQASISYCPKCGTVKVSTESPNVTYTLTPKLVERCREFEKVILDDLAIAPWIATGIAEAINKPEDRPQ